MAGGGPYPVACPKQPGASLESPEPTPTGVPDRRLLLFPQFRALCRLPWGSRGHPRQSWSLIKVPSCVDASRQRLHPDARSCSLEEWM
jgi:hypothetical protein